ncbi:MAG: hypothetical protein LBS23_00430 [Holosporaceae bacterium]|jgi:hydroxymethylglutaryl-CoA reductase (NADPH)|nr:hypothetical protein [Holosporaceae bacterium]
MDFADKPYKLMNLKDSEFSTEIPTKVVGPIKINYDGKVQTVSVPVATFEIPLWSSIARGALVSTSTDGICVRVIDDIMSRSVILEATDLTNALICKTWIDDHMDPIADIVKNTSCFANLKQINVENIGKLLYVRLGITTTNASGHNMATKAADAVLNFIISSCKHVKYVSISGNYCTDKKVSSVNGILGRGKRVSAEIIVPYAVCGSILKTIPEKIVELNTKKNLLGSILSGGVRSANAHFANVALAIYLATGQDAANVVEASQGITFANLLGKDLYFSVNMPNIIVGTVGNGKNLDFAVKNLEFLECHSSVPGSAKRLAAIIASATLCAELSLMAAITNQGELMRSHLKLERNSKCK